MEDTVAAHRAQESGRKPIACCVVCSPRARRQEAEQAAVLMGSLRRCPRNTSLSSACRLEKQHQPAPAPAARQEEATVELQCDLSSGDAQLSTSLRQATEAVFQYLPVRVLRNPNSF